MPYATKMPYAAVKKKEKQPSVAQEKADSYPDRHPRMAKKDKIKQDEKSENNRNPAISKQRMLYKLAEVHDKYTFHVKPDLEISKQADTLTVFKRLFDDSKIKQTRTNELGFKLKQEEQISLFKTLKDNKFTNPHKNLTDLIIKLSLKQLQERVLDEKDEKMAKMDFKQVID
jgi:hypothetical protein